MRSSRWMLVLLLAAAMPLAGCSKGGECDSCSNVDDCESGLTCQQFVLDNGDLRNLCGDANTVTCRVSN